VIIARRFGAVGRRRRDAPGAERVRRHLGTTLVTWAEVAEEFRE